MLLSEQLLLEGVQDIKEMIFDKTEHTALAKLNSITNMKLIHNLELYDVIS